MSQIDKSTSVAEILSKYPAARRVFDRHGLGGCGGGQGPSESLAFFARMHEVDADSLVQEIESAILSPAPGDQVYQESLPDFIYRRFFKAGIALALSLGAFWGATNLLQIALGRNFLQLRLVPAIQAHAHVMIFGWVGLFVMGFAYQSFPRFKFTTLWRPDLANLSFFLMLGGIVSRVAAEMLQPAALGLALGALSILAEVTAIGLFVAVILKTAQKSVQPRTSYERFILTALFWFFAQSLLSGFFFFAKATATGEQQLIHRIALVDGPLRDVQLLGFIALIIAGVSQRFIPAVYGLDRPKRDHARLIFWLMNGSLALDVASYLLLLTTHNWIFGVALEISFLLMLAWAILLVRQLRVFSPPTERDRSFKFIRAAYVWLLVAMGMLPFYPLYTSLTHQVFSHTYMGAYRHAFTVGFVSLMIMGVASRIVPILAGVDSKKTTSLAGPFILINVGCAGRVILQILTDFQPGTAYPLVGLTGFIEVAALAWWGIDLWHTMNLAGVHRADRLRAPASPSPLVTLR